MTLVLSNLEQREFAETVRALLSPFDEPLDPWRAEVLCHLTALLGTDLGGFILPLPEGSPYTLHNLPDSFAREYFETFQAHEKSAPLLGDSGGGVWSTRMLRQRLGATVEEDFWDSLIYREFYSRYDIREGIGFSVLANDPLALSDGRRLAPGGTPVAAVLTCFHREFGTEAFGDHGLAILQLLLPALEAGVAGRARLGWIRHAVQELFDVVRDGLLVCNADGRRLYANAALTRILEQDSEAPRLRSSIEAMARALREMKATRNGAARAELSLMSREVRGRQARYRLRGHLVGTGIFGDGATILVSVEQLTPEMPSLARLQERWQLTRQEARVALLLAEGMTNQRIAAAMELCPSTTRHYTEAIFAKLGVHSRAQVRATISRGA